VFVYSKASFLRGINEVAQAFKPGTEAANDRA
jgi:hypothetical protein